MPFQSYLSTSMILAQLKAMSPGRITISRPYFEYNYHTDCQFCLQAELSNECAEQSPTLFKTIFQVKLSYRFKALYPRRPEQ